jgi:hypothetical protein
MDPEERAAFDAGWRVDNSPRHIPFVGCFARFSAHSIQWWRVSKSLKLGPLPCYVVPPWGGLAEGKGQPSDAARPP